jgi:hypothetical protein
MCAGSCHRRNIKLGTRIRVAVGIIMTNAFGNIVQDVNCLQNVLAQAEDDKSDTHQADATNADPLHLGAMSASFSSPAALRAADLPHGEIHCNNLQNGRNWMQNHLWK